MSNLNPKKRENNEGSVYQRKDGKWCASIRVGDKRLYRYAASKPEALQKLNELRHHQYQGTITLPSKTTLAQWVDQWLKLVEPDLRPTTLRTYRQTIGYVTRIAGKQRLDKLTPLALSQVFAHLQQRGESPRSVYLAHGYLRACLQHAVDLELLPSNPMEKVKKPRWVPRKRVYWSVEEVNRFISAGLSERGHWHPLWVFMVTTGLRVSEALGLTWADVDWERQRVRVERAIVFAGQQSTTQPPKTKAGNRWVTLSSTAIEALRRVPRELDLNAGIFRTAKGTVPTPSDLRARLIRLCELAEVPVINIHGLRHVAAMLALEATGDAYLVQKHLGHSHISVTLGIYGYSARQNNAVADALDKLLTAG